jgi:hypothetical protein
MMMMCHSKPYNPRPIFDEAGHRYYLDGESLPSVTTVLTASGLLDLTIFGVIDQRK